MIIKNHYLLHLLFNLINENEIVYYFPRIPCAFSLFFIQSTKNVMEVKWRERGSCFRDWPLLVSSMEKGIHTRRERSFIRANHISI